MKALNISIKILLGLVAITAIGGGIAMLVGADKFPKEWLAGTPFVDYTIPALILTLVVGGSALVAFIANIKTHRLHLTFTLISALLLFGFISVEVIILKQNPPGPTFMEWLYWIIAIAVSGASLAKHKISKRAEANN